MTIDRSEILADYIASHGFGAAPPAQAVPEDVRRDAERYQWLRDASPHAGLVTPSVVQYASYRADHWDYLDGEGLDEAIDAVMAAPGAQN